MKRRNIGNQTLLFLILIFVFFACSETEPENYEDPNTLDLTEFTFLPESPNAKVETQLVFYGCSYYQTTSVLVDNKQIDIKKHFNGQLKWPCVIAYDTINLGKLKKGEYQVNLQIIDTNPFAQDSVFYTETKTLIVSNK